MSTDSANSNPAWMVWTGRVISGVAVVGLLASAGFKLMKPNEVLEEFARLGYSENLVVIVGITEIACIVMYAIPQTAVLGAILLVGYLGGATATHVRIADPFVPPIIAGVLAWLGLYLRDSRLRALVPLRSLSPRPV